MADGPEQHAATVRKCHADAMTALAADVHPYSAEAIRQQEEALGAALDELVALAGRAQEDADGSRFLRGLADASSDNWRARAEAAEARADELERDLAKSRAFAQDGWDARNLLADRNDELADMFRAKHREAEQARREADQLRAALRGVAWRDSAGLCWCPGETEFAVAHPGAEHTERCKTARVALAGVQAEEEA